MTIFLEIQKLSCGLFDTLFCYHQDLAKLNYPTSIALTADKIVMYQLDSRRCGGILASANGFNLRPSLRVAAKLSLVL